MKRFLITDLHFGCHQNSPIWLNSQLDFFHQQFIPALKKDWIIYCLGDIFDVRSSIQGMIASKVRNLFQNLSKVCPVYVIGGNHDYFSPASDEYCSLDIVLSHIPDVTLITHEVLQIDDDVLIPWYIQEREGITKLSKKYKGCKIFTHTDLVTNPPKVYTPVYSGHVHQPFFQGNLFNLGSTFPLTFSDANSLRGYYELEEDLKFIENKYCIRFWRDYEGGYKDDAWWKDKNQRDYIELYLPQEDLYKDQEYLQEKKRLFDHLNIIPKMEYDIYKCAEIDPDILSIVKNNIPENLRDTFEVICTKINEKK